MLKRLLFSMLWPEDLLGIDDFHRKMALEEPLPLHPPAFRHCELEAVNDSMRHGFMQAGKSDNATRGPMEVLCFLSLELGELSIVIFVRLRFISLHACMRALFAEIENAGLCVD